MQERLGDMAKVPYGINDDAWTRPNLKISHLT